MRLNILFNTTRQWNPGDQFIMLGVQRLMEHVDYNPIIYNRHPNIWGKGADNSFKPDIVNYDDEAGPRTRHTVDAIDYYIAAGTPEWDTRGLYPVFDQLADKKIRNSWIGVGCGLPLSEKLRDVVKYGDVFITRDQCALGAFKDRGGVNLPCPAFFVGEKATLRFNIDDPVVGLVYMSDRTGANRVTPECRKNMITQYTRALKAFPRSIIICHYIDEALDARKVFPGAKVYYSHDAKDFEAYFDKCDITIGPRLHGTVFGASLGIPGYIILDNQASPDSKGRRRGGIKPFDMPVFDEHSSNSIVDAIKSIDIEKESRRLRKLRYMTHMKYMNLMTNKMRDVFKYAFPSCKEIFKGIPHYAPTSGEASVPALDKHNYYQFYRILGQQEKPKKILEIGTRYGYSLISMVVGAGDTVEEVVSIDKEAYGNCFNKPTQQIAEENLRAKGYKGISKFHRDDSANIKKHIQENDQFDIIHVDGDHSYDGAKRDLNNVWPHVKRGGLIAVDDMDNNSVYRAVEDFLDQVGIRTIDFMASRHGLALIRKQ